MYFGIFSAYQFDLSYNKKELRGINVKKLDTF